VFARAVFAMGLLIALCAIAEAAPAQRAHQHVIVRPNQGSVRPNQSVTTPPAGRSTIPGLDPGRGWSNAG
jgi:hypothetical protein